MTNLVEVIKQEALETQLCYVEIYKLNALKAMLKKQKNKKYTLQFFLFYILADERKLCCYSCQVCRRINHALPSEHLPAHSQQRLTLNIFTPFSDVSIVDFKHVFISCGS